MADWGGLRHIARCTRMHVPCNMHPRVLRGATDPNSALARSALMLHIANAPSLQSGHPCRPKPVCYQVAGVSCSAPD